MVINRGVGCRGRKDRKAPHACMSKMLSHSTFAAQHSTAQHSSTAVHVSPPCPPAGHAGCPSWRAAGP